VTYLIHRTNVLPQLIAVIRARVPQRELPRVVPAFCGEVWEFARTAQLAKPGRHVAVYLDGAITLECGVEVAAPFMGIFEKSLVKPGDLVSRDQLLGRMDGREVRWEARPGLAIEAPQAQLVPR